MKHAVVAQTLHLVDEGRLRRRLAVKLPGPLLTAAGKSAFFLLIVPALVSAGPRPHPVSRKKLDRAIDRAAEYLVQHTLQDGRFVYRTNLNPRVDVAPKYNMLRHAGTIYALCDYHLFRPTAATERTLLTAGQFLQTQIADLEEVPDVLAIWSEPKINGAAGERKAKLGGTGLGLVALTQLERLRPGFTPAPTLRKLGNFVLFMQKADGSFYSIYRPGFPGRDGSWTSLYYPGEAALGLLRLNDLYPDPEYVAGAYEALAYLARVRASSDTVPADHWALLATAKLLEKPPPQIADSDVSLLISHAAQICRQIVAEQRPQNERPKLRGSFVPDGRTTPTATRLEGLEAGLEVLPLAGFRKLREEMVQACDLGVQFLLGTQITGGDAVGGIPRVAPGIAADTQDPSFRRRATEIRIDYVQHALSAWMQYRTRVWGSPGANVPRTGTK